jgi:hypothetical protein
MTAGLYALPLCAAAFLLCSCAATSVKQTWKSPDLQQPVGKVAVLAIENRGLVRQGLENRFVRDLSKAGSSAFVTFDLLSLSQIKEDKRAAADRFRASGAEAVIIMRLVDVGTSYHESRSGNERYAGTFTGINSTGWYDYFSVGLMDLNTTYGTLKQTVRIETTLYDLSTEKRLWSGLTQTVVKEDMDRVAEMDPLVEKIVAAMKKDGVIK